MAWIPIVGLEQMRCSQVAGLAGASARLAALREQHAELEREADEAFVLQTQLPDLEEAAAKAGMLRRRFDALQAEISQARMTVDLTEQIAIEIWLTGWDDASRLIYCQQSHAFAAPTEFYHSLLISVEGSGESNFRGRDGAIKEASPRSTSPTYRAKAG